MAGLERILDGQHITKRLKGMTRDNFKHKKSKISSYAKHRIVGAAGAMNMPELMITLAVTGILAAIVSPSVSFATKPLNDSMERVQANFKLGRAKAMSQTTAYRVRPNGTDGLILERHASGVGSSSFSCADSAIDTDGSGESVWTTAAGFNPNEDMALEEGVIIKSVTLDGVDVASLTDWELCYDSRGYADKNMILALENTKSGEAKMIEIYTGGSLVSYDSNRIKIGPSSPIVEMEGGTGAGGSTGSTDSTDSMGSTDSTDYSGSTDSSSSTGSSGSTGATKLKCNKGGGNGSEGCDPGNNPDLGNDDEG